MMTSAPRKTVSQRLFHLIGQPMRLTQRQRVFHLQMQLDETRRPRLTRAQIVRAFHPGQEETTSIIAWRSSSGNARSSSDCTAS